MKYRDASDMLPDELSRRLQQYASIEAICVPSLGERKRWGQESGARLYYEQRNRDIQRGFRAGIGIDRLAGQYCLSEDRIRRIVYDPGENIEDRR